MRELMNFSPAPGVGFIPKIAPGSRLWIPVMHDPRIEIVTAKIWHPVLATHGFEFITMLLGQGIDLGFEGGIVVVLEIGLGTGLNTAEMLGHGRECLGLSARGLRVLGLDQSIAMMSRVNLMPRICVWMLPGAMHPHRQQCIKI